MHHAPKILSLDRRGYLRREIIEDIEQRIGSDEIFKPYKYFDAQSF